MRMPESMVVGIGLFVACFLLGSVPWGVVISRAFFHMDVREHGSGNIGTTNAIRAMGKVGGYAVFVLDFGKGLLSGALALAAARLCAGGGQPDPAFAQLLLAIAFSGCVWGHIFCPWLGFRGGKGIAVAVGCLFVTFGPAGALIELAVFAVLVVATRYVSVGSVAAAAVCPLLALWFYWGNWIAWALVAAAALTVVWAHRGNVERLCTGTERRIGHGE